MDVTHEIERYTHLLSLLCGDSLAVKHKHIGGELPYSWQVETTVEPILYVATVKLTSQDILTINDKDDGEKLQYLRARFGHLFVVPRSSSH